PMQSDMDHPCKKSGDEQEDVQDREVAFVLHRGAPDSGGTGADGCATPNSSAKPANSGGRLNCSPRIRRCSGVRAGRSRVSMTEGAAAGPLSQLAPASSP